MSLDCTEKKKNLRLAFFCESRALFAGPANTESDKINFKIGSHGIIHTFKNYFAALFSTISCIQTNPYFAQKYHTFEPKFSQEIRVWSFGASSWAQNTSRIVFCAKTSRTYFLEKYSSFKSSFLCKIKRLDLWCEFWVSFSWNWKLLIESTVQRARSKKLAE